MLVIGITGCFIIYFADRIDIGLTNVAKSIVDRVKDHIAVNIIILSLEHITCCIL